MFCVLYKMVQKQLHRWTKVDNLRQKRNEHSRLLFSKCRSVSEVFFASTTPVDTSFVFFTTIPGNCFMD